MPLSRSSVLHYWSARYGPIPVIGGKPVHSRSSAARWVDQQGVLQSAIVNTPRAEWATIDGERRQVMRLEQARTNALTYSEEFDNTAWTKNACSITANTIIAPDGTLTADKIVESATTDVHYVTRSVAGCTDNTSQALSVYAKAGERIWLFVAIVTKAPATAGVYFNLSTGTVGTQSGGASGRIAALGAGWYRCEVQLASVGVGASTPRAEIYVVTADGGTTYAGNGTSGLYVWGGQFEVDKKAVSSYAATTASAAARAADAFYWDFVHATQAMMGYGRFVERGTILDGGRLLQIGKSDNTTPQLLIYSNGGYFVYHHNGTAAVQIGVSAPGVGDVVELAFYLKSDGKVRIIESVNGAAVIDSGETAANALAAAWSDTRLWLNSVGSTIAGLNDFAELKLVKYADVVASTAQGIMDELRAFELTASGEAIS